MMSLMYRKGVKNAKNDKPLDGNDEKSAQREPLNNDRKKKLVSYELFHWFELMICPSYRESGYMAIMGYKCVAA